MPYTGVTSLAAKHPSFPCAGIKRATFTDFVEKVELLSREIAIQVVLQSCCKICFMFLLPSLPYACMVKNEPMAPIKRAYSKASVFGDKKSGL